MCQNSWDHSEKPAITWDKGMTWALKLTVLSVLFGLKNRRFVFSRNFQAFTLKWQLWYSFLASSWRKQDNLNLGPSPGFIVRQMDIKPLLGPEASLMAQSVKNLPVMQKTWVWSVDWEDPLEKKMATHSSILG